MIKNSILFLAIILLGMSCKVNRESRQKATVIGTADNHDTMKSNNLDTKSLEFQLNERREAFAQKAPADVKEKYEAGVKAVATSGVLKTALNVGDKAIDFALKNQNNETVTLFQELKKGPVVLTWYRGGWCPYCNLTLRYLQDRLPDFKSEGASLIAITPELPDQSLNTSEKNNLEFTVLSDVGNLTGKKYGLVFKLTKEVADIYQNNFNLHAYNGDESDELPVAATYVIGTDGIVKYAFLDADYRKRA